MPVVVYNLKLLVIGNKSACYRGGGLCVNYGLRVNQWKKVKFR